jgi:hypothetical protein
MIERAAVMMDLATPSLLAVWTQRRITMPNRKLILGLMILLVAFVVAGRSSGTAAPPAEQKRIAFLDRLKVGQAVALTDKDGRFEIGVFPPALQPLGHTVIEVAQDCVVVRDLGNITDTIIPIYSIKSIKVMRFPGK